MSVFFLFFLVKDFHLLSAGCSIQKTNTIEVLVKWSFVRKATASQVCELTKIEISRMGCNLSAKTSETFWGGWILLQQNPNSHLAVEISQECWGLVPGVVVCTTNLVCVSKKKADKTGTLQPDAKTRSETAFSIEFFFLGLRWAGLRSTTAQCQIRLITRFRAVNTHQSGRFFTDPPLDLATACKIMGGFFSSTTDNGSNSQQRWASQPNWADYYGRLEDQHAWSQIHNERWNRTYRRRYTLLPRKLILSPV